MTETGLDNSITSQLLFGVGFNVFRCDRSPANSNKVRFGGVLIAIAQQYASREVPLSRGQSLEQVVSLRQLRERSFICAQSTFHRTKAKT